MTGAELVLECLKKEGVDTIFGYPGGAVIPLYDALYDYADDFVHIRTSHEQGLVHAADGYARSTGKTGVCIVTSGPGATNAITGIATAYMDSTPLVVISGQVGSVMLGKDSFQEIDITGMTLSVTKHSYLLRDTKDIAPTIKEAFKIAQSDRKGPVLIDIPKDLFTAEIQFNPLENYEDQTTFEILSDEYTEDDIEKAIKLINESRKPVIYAGGGVKASNSFDELLNFAEKSDIPVINSLMGLGDIDRKNSLSLGLVGMHGFKESNFAMSKADLVIALGIRFSDRGTGLTSAFANNAKIIHVDIDKSELGKNISTDLEIIGSIKNVLPQFTSKVHRMNRTEWKKEINSYRQTDSQGTEIFHPKNIISTVNDFLDKRADTIVVTDVGQHQMWTAQHWKFNKGRNFITSGGLGTMGFGLGASIGCAIGNPNKQVVLVTGDGSFKMNLNELSTVREYELPILIILFNNHSLGMVRQWQKLFSNCRYSQTDISNNLDYIKLSQAFGINADMISNITELKDTLQKLDYSKPNLLVCNIDKDFDVYPIVPPNDILEHLIIG